MRNRDDTSLLRQVATELQAALVAERTNIGTGEVGALRANHAQPDLFEAIAEQVALGAQIHPEFTEVFVGQTKPGGNRILEWPA